LIALLRLGGVVTVTAFAAMWLPVEWMASTHERLGLGEFPRTAVVAYLARSIAALYGFHGVLLLIVATDPSRFRRIVWYVAGMNVTFGVMMVAVDVEAGMPSWWTIAEGPPIVVFGILIGLLNRSLAQENGKVNS
jgi:hypothetical protein